jgi:transcriptional regulator with XRE-family HTH domain
VNGYQFARLFREAVEANGSSYGGVARALGVSKQNAREWATGTRLPRLETAAKLADALNEPALLAAVQVARTRVCRNCKARMVVNTSRRLFCSEECNLLYRAKTGKAVPRKPLTVIEDRLDTYKAAVEAFCQSCEPGGVCRTVECELRPVSPLPCLIGKVEPAAPDARRGRWSDERRQQQGDRMRSYHARRREAIPA